MITREEIETALEESEEYQENESCPDDVDWNKVKSDDLQFEEVENGSDMDDTDHKYIVVKVSRIKDPEVFKHIKLEGYYNSWEGTEWNRLVHIVEPKIIHKTIWVKLEE